MPGSTRRFEYTLTPVRGDVDKVAEKARKILAWACEGDRRITCHGVRGSGVEGEPLGRVTLSMTIRGRDRWWATQLAQDILDIITWGLEAKVDLDLRSARLSPHLNRGYARGNRTKTWKDPKEK
jgi:hypothetical protein